MEVSSFGIKVQAQASNILLSTDALFDFEDNEGWENLADGLDTVVDDPTILLDQYQLPPNKCLDLVDSIV